MQNVPNHREKQDIFTTAIEATTEISNPKTCVAAFGSFDAFAVKGSNLDRANWLCGQLWNCGDILPGGCCDALDIPRGSTYAVAARDVKRFLKSKHSTGR